MAFFWTWASSVETGCDCARTTGAQNTNIKGRTCFHIPCSYIVGSHSAGDNRSLARSACGIDAQRVAVGNQSNGRIVASDDWNCKRGVQGVIEGSRGANRSLISDAPSLYIYRTCLSPYSELIFDKNSLLARVLESLSISNSIASTGDSGFSTLRSTQIRCRSSFGMSSSSFRVPER